MKHYAHLAQEERYQIHALMKAGHTPNEIAVVIGRSPATISRERRRNRGQRGYRPQQAHRLAMARASAARTHPRITARQWRAVGALIRQVRIPVHAGHRFRRMPVHYSGGCQSIVPVMPVHPGVRRVTRVTVTPFPLRRGGSGGATEVTHAEDSRGTTS